MIDNVYRLHESMLNEKINVALVGVGGSGGYMLESLVKINAVLLEMGHCGVDITVFDSDEVSHSNVGRTKYSSVDVGQNKANLLVARYNQFYGLNMESIPKKFSVIDDVSEFDLIVSCTDSAVFRIAMGEFSENFRSDCNMDRDVLWLDMGNSDYSAQFVLGHLFKDNSRKGVFLPNVYDLYGEALREVVKSEENQSSCGLLEAVEIQSLFVNPTVASHASALLYELFKKGVIRIHGGEIDLENHSAKPMPINSDVWAFMGVKIDR